MKKQYQDGDLQVWWIPQIPMKPFEVDVSSVEEAVKIIDVLAAYDDFQYRHNVKPDYANAGGLRRWGENAIDGEFPGWEDWYDKETGEDNPAVWLAEKRKS